ncbi:MAG TPA: adenylate/guanylate cyclase domain-containing protein [Thermoleophilaceae bacterium]|nr:adenylate/guanylate cyclase domain-containing protein [Thermoleophilaceae bacterium]
MGRSPVPSGDPADVDFFQLMERHLPRAFISVMRRLPSEPRCRLCQAPFGGPGGRVMARLGFGPSRKNPTLCNTCFEKAPMGGVEMEIGVLFADVRGFTSLAEDMAPEGVAKLLNRFYAAASHVLSRSAIIDKLVGDEVMALYVPQLFRGEGWQDDIVRDARDLLAAVGYGAGGPWLEVGVGVDIGPAFVGNVGAGDVKDFTALGDVVNTAARLQAQAAPGQIVISERLFGRFTAAPGDATPAELSLKGKRAPERARVIDLRA